VFRPKHVEQLRNIGITNSTTRLHLVGSFYEIYINQIWREYRKLGGSKGAIKEQEITFFSWDRKGKSSIANKIFLYITERYQQLRD
jgi:hypothetical protein